MTRKQLLISTALIALAVIVLLIVPDEPRPTYRKCKGQVFGTYYAIQYEGVSDLTDSIHALFADFDASMSMFNPSSVLSRINQGADSTADEYFIEMYHTANEINRLSGGAFDITVAPLVNLWGFGLENRTHVTQEQVDSILPHIGQDKLILNEAVVRKTDPRVMIDAGAIAKGQCCDVVAALFSRNGSANYLVDIGGEVVAEGNNPQQQPWRIGITRPQDDLSGAVNDIQTVLQTTHIALATSGNYRNFYYDGKQKRSHTIDPRSGYPVQHNLLSATVRSTSCMRADALATACMVLGEEEAMNMIEADSLSACYLIVADVPAGADSIVMRVIQSSRW